MSLSGVFRWLEPRSGELNLRLSSFWWLNVESCGAIQLDIGLGLTSLKGTVGPWQSCMLC